MRKTMKKKGYRFEGWYIDPERTKKINPGGRLPTSTTLYDKWKPIQYAIKYNLHGGVNTRKNPRMLTIESGEIPLYPAKKRKFIFSGWKLNDQYITSIPAGLSEPIELEAVFSEPPYIMFETNGGGRIQAKQLTEHSTLEPFPNPKRLGYEFVGWFFDEECTNPFQFDMKLDHTSILYAKWQLIHYTVEYQYQEGQPTKENCTKYTIEDEDIVLYPATKEGYVFDGWYDSRGQKQECIRSKSVGNRIYMAHYHKVES